MKIIKKGHKQKGWSKEFKCAGKGNGGGGCGAILLVEEGDLYYRRDYAYDLSYEVYTTFSCPCCRVETDVNVPDSIKILENKPKRKSRRKS